MAEKTTIASELKRIQDARDTIRRKLGPLEMGLLDQEEADGGANLSKLAEKIDGITVDESSTLILDGIDGSATLLPGYYKNKINISVAGSSGDYHLHGLGTITPTESVQTFKPSSYVSAQHDKVYGFSDFTVAAIPKQYGNVNKIVNATDVADYILAGNSAIVKGVDAGGGAIAKYVKGSMANHGEVNSELSSSNNTYKIQAGYYSGGTIGLAEGTVTTTDATASANEILSGETAYVNGAKVTGTIPMKNSDSIYFEGAKVKIPKGYYSEVFTEKTMPSAVLDDTVITVNANGNGRIEVVTQITTDGYIGTDPITSGIDLDAVDGHTIIPSKATTQIAIDANHFAKGQIVVDKIPDQYQDVGSLTKNKTMADASKVLSGYKIVSNDGTTLIDGTMVKRTSPKITLDSSTVKYDIAAGYYEGGSIQINTQTANFELTQRGYTFSSDPDYVFTEVSVPGVDTYLRNRVNVTASQVVSGAKFVDQEGTPMTGTMPEQEGEFKWDYKEYEEFFPIPAGAYAGKSTFVAEDYEYLDYENVSSWEAISPYANADGDLKPEYEFVNNTFPPHILDMKSVSLYKLPIAGNGNILTIGAYGVGYTMGQDNFDETWDIAFNDGTVYVVYSNHTSPSHDFMAWVNNYTYGTPSAYVTMPDLVDALAAI